MLDAIQRAIARGRTVALLYKGRARVLYPESVTATHLRGWCPHRLAHRQFALARIEALKVWKKLESFGPESLGPPIRIGEPFMLPKVEHAALACITDTAELVRRLEAMSPREAGDAYQKFQAACRTLSEFEQMGKAAFLERVETLGDLIVQTEAGERRIYAANDNTTKCRDAKKALTAILSESGDIDAVAAMLTTQPFKPGACKAILGERWGDHFEVEEKLKLNEGAPKRVLKQTRDE